MGNNTVEETFQTRLPVDRRIAVDRRMAVDRRFIKQEYLDRNPERRVNIINRRMHGDRRRMLAEIIYTLWGEA